MKRAAVVILTTLVSSALSCASTTPSSPAVTRPATAARPARQAPVVGDYQATWEPASGSVKVEARFTASAGAVFSVDRGADAFAKDVEMSADRDGAPWSPVVHRGRELHAALCGAGACRLRYRFALRDAAKRLDDLDVANEEGEVVEAPPSTWLLVPAKIQDAAKRKVIVDFMKWMLVDGQKMTEALAYAKLPRQVVAKEMKAIAMVQ